MVTTTCLQDSFYSRFKGSPFPEAIEANGSELAAVTQKVQGVVLQRLFDPVVPLGTHHL